MIVTALSLTRDSANVTSFRTTSKVNVMYKSSARHSGPRGTMRIGGGLRKPPHVHDYLLSSSSSAWLSSVAYKSSALVGILSPVLKRDILVPPVRPLRKDSSIFWILCPQRQSQNSGYGLQWWSMWTWKPDALPYLAKVTKARYSATSQRNDMFSR